MTVASNPIYAVVVILQDSAPFLRAWATLEKSNFPTQLNHNIGPHISLATREFEARTFDTADFWQKILPKIQKARLDRVCAVYDGAPLHTFRDGLLVRPFIPDGDQFKAVLAAQTAIMKGFGYTKKEQKDRRNLGLHTTYSPVVPLIRIRSASSAIRKAWGSAGTIVTNFTEISLQKYDPVAKKFKREESLCLAA